MKAGLERVKKTSKRVVETKVERFSFGNGCDPQLLPYSKPRRSVIAAKIEPPGRATYPRQAQASLLRSKRWITRRIQAAHGFGESLGKIACAEVDVDQRGL